VVGVRPRLARRTVARNILIERRVDIADTTYRIAVGKARALDVLRASGVSVMTGSHVERTPGRSAKAVIAVTLLALLLLAAVPVALLAAVIMMILGHVVGGLALFGGSVLAAAMTVALAGMTGMQHLRKVLSRASFSVVQLDHRQDTDDSAEPNGSDYTDVVQLDRSEYTEVP
jgi:hypothetical protein